LKLKLKRKFLTTLCSTLIVTVIFIIYISIQNSMLILGLIPFVFLYAFIGNITYGMTISLISDYVSGMLNIFRVVLSGTIHLVSGFIAMFIVNHYFINGFGIYAVLSMVCFFVIDEYFRTIQTINNHTLNLNKGETFSD
jgi:hypothetical protein